MDNNIVSHKSNMPTEISVSQLSNALKRTVEEKFSLVKVRGQISGFKRAASGHIYMDLKDEHAVINCVCWRGVAQKLRFLPSEGLEVVVVGRISTYPARSNYQIICRTIELAGQGALLKILQLRKEQLAKDGLFDQSRKKPLPNFPQSIGVITSITGAAIRDILHRLQERFVFMVYIYPSAVQGENAIQDIVQAIAFFNAQRHSQSPVIQHLPEVLIVARGGGSIEDLWAFNEEAVVRAVADSNIPVISAIGHEIDTMLVDHAADFRSPTPTAAAERVAPTILEVRTRLCYQEARLHKAFSRILKEGHWRLKALQRALNIENIVEPRSQRFDYIQGRYERLCANMFVKQDAVLLRYAEKIVHLDACLKNHELRLEKVFNAVIVATKNIIDAHERNLQRIMLLAESYSFKKTLNRGFALIKDDSGHIIRDSQKASIAKHITVVFSEGKISAKVL